MLRQLEHAPGNFPLSCCPVSGNASLSATPVKMAKNSCPLLRGCSTACREDHPLLEPWAPADHHPQVLPCSKFSVTLVLCWLWGPEYKGDRFLALRTAITLLMNNVDAISENCYCINLFKVVDSTKIQLNNDLSKFSVRLEISMIFQREQIPWQNARQTSYNISHNLLVPTLKGRKHPSLIITYPVWSPVSCQEVWT